METLKITPPFFYSYQCGSTLLTAYLPVYLYSIALQIMSIAVTTMTILLISSHTQCPNWFLDSFPGICWPWRISQQRKEKDEKTTRLIKPHQILSNAANNIVLLLSFGLCSPALCGSIALCVSLHLSSWLLLIRRFVSSRLDRETSALALSSSVDSGSLTSPSHPSLPPP
jgi:hypothetical protein